MRNFVTGLVVRCRSTVSRTTATTTECKEQRKLIMNKVTMPGSFRGFAQDWGVSLTSNSECPQFTMDVVLTEYWNEDEQVWQDYSGQEEYIPAYMVMVSGKGKVLKNMEQVMKVFSWDGLSFSALAEGNYEDVPFQIRIGDNDPEYADKNPYTVEWLDEYDATPGRGIKKLDTKELSALDTKFAVILKKKAGPGTAKSAPPTNTKGKAAAKDKVDSSKVMTAAEKMKANQDQKDLDDAAKATKQATAAQLKKEKAALALKKKNEKAGKGKKSGKREMPVFQKPAPAADEQEGDLVEDAEDDAVPELTQEEAWERIEAAQEQMGSDDEVVNDALMAAIKEVGECEAPDVDSFNKLQWGQVSEVAIKTLVGV